MTKQRTFYSREFKLAILSQVEAGIPVAQVARENGLHPTLVTRWKKEYLEDPEKAFSGPGHPYMDQARVAELERMVGKLYAENMFLKKNLGDNERTSRGSEKEISIPERYKMIWQNQRDPYRIRVRIAADLLNVSKSGYYDWLKRKGHNPRRCRDKPVLEKIRKIIREYPGYGYRRDTYELRRHGFIINHKRVLRLMREAKLTFKKSRFRLITTDSEHGNPVYPNLVRYMDITRPNQVWGADFTYVQLRNEYIYLAVEIDLYGRRVIGWSLSRNLDTDTALDALQRALYNRRDQDLSGLIHHSDRGVKYTSMRFTECLRNHGIQISNSRKGNPYDNAYVESFFKTLKTEEVYLNEYETFDDALENIGGFIDEVYNKKRMHSALGYMSPVEYERRNGLFITANQ